MPRFASLLLALACAHRPAPGGNGAEAVRYAVELHAAFETSLVEGGAEARAALAALPPAGRDIELVVSMAEARRYRDDSIGTLVVFESAAGGPPGLRGRSVELRRFGDGEILDLYLTSHIAGGDRQGEIFDVVFPLLSPLPPDLKEPGDADHRTQRWPVEAGPGRGWESRAAPTWTWVDTADVKGVRAFHLAYEGPWATRGKDAAAGATVLAEGAVRGEAWFARDGYALLAHEFEWERIVDLRYERAPEGVAVVRQRQVYRGRAARLPPGPLPPAAPPPPDDDRPLPRYADEAAVEAAVLAGLPSWQDCADRGLVPSATGAPFALTFGPGGGATGASVEPGCAAVPPGEESPCACWERGARALAIPPHDEPSLTARFHVGFAGGRVLAPVSIAIEPRATDPLFLYVPPDLPGAERAAILRALGLAPPGGSTLPRAAPPSPAPGEETPP